MTLVDIDNSAFGFINKLVEAERPPAPEARILKGNNEPIRLGDAMNFSIEGVNPNDGAIIKKFTDVNGRLIGLNEGDFFQLKSLVSSLMDLEPFASLVDNDFLVRESFKWLIELYKNKKAGASLSNHLLNVVDNAIVEHTFYFIVEPLEIEANFSIGDVNFRVFDEVEIQKMYQAYIQSHPNTTLERFKSVCGKSFKRVNAIVVGRGVYSRAEAEAMRKAELAVDALKCCWIGDAMQYKVQVFDLDYRLQRPMSGFFLTHNLDRIDNLTAQIRNKGQIAAMSLTKQKLDEVYENGLSRLSRFIQHPKKDNELYEDIIGLVHQLGSILSNSDNFEKIVKLVSFFESFLLSTTGGGKAMGQTKVKMAISGLQLNKHDKDRLLKYLPKLYSVRDKYLHNYRKLEVDITELMFFLNFARVFILLLIRHNDDMDTTSAIHQYIGII